MRMFLKSLFEWMLWMYRKKVATALSMYEACLLHAIACASTYTPV